MVRVGLLFGHVAGYSDLLATSKVTVRSSDYSRAVHSAAALLYGLGPINVSFVFISAKVNVVNTGGDTVFTHSVRRSVVPSVLYMMTRNSNDVIAPIAQAATLAVTFPSLYSAAKRLFLLPPLFSL